MTMKKRNVYSIINGAAVSCCVTVNRWLIGAIKNICTTCGVAFKIDDSSIDERTDTVDAVFAAAEVNDYIDAACLLHNELGVDLA